MNYWVTSHWPPSAEDKPTTSSPDPAYHYRIYLPDGREGAGQELRKDDLVFIYESKTGRPLKNGRKYAPGRQGIIALVRAREPITEKPNDKPEKYADGSEILWKWQAGTKMEKLGFCSHENVCRILRFKKGYTFHGFGDQHSGLKKIDEKKYEALLECLRAVAQPR